MTATEGIEWAELMIAKLGSGHVLAAIVRGNDLWIRSEGEFWQQGRHGITELYKFVPDGSGPYNGQVELEVDGGTVYIDYAWCDHTQQPSSPQLVECQEALIDAQRKLDVFTDPQQRATKVLELLRWSHLAGRSDFSFD